MSLLNVEKRLALGAVVVAILNGREISTDSFLSLYDHGRKTLRCVVLDKETIPTFERFILGEALASDIKAYDVSRDVGNLTIDKFISHSWFDDAKKKCKTILEWSHDFTELNERALRVWCDKLCLKQTPEDLAMSVRCLPVYLLASDRVLLLRLKSFLSRLWCLPKFIQVRNGKPVF